MQGSLFEDDYLTDRDWAWPKQLHRLTLERVFTLDFPGKGENVRRFKKPRA